MISKHSSHLRSIFEQYALERDENGLPNRMDFSGWEAFLTDTRALEYGVGAREARLSYAWSLPFVSDEVQSRDKVETIGCASVHTLVV